MSYLPCVEIEPKAPATGAVIWLHGLGADGHDFEPIVPELKLPDSLPLRFVFPHAPAIPVTVNGGMVMPAWFDILGIGGDMSIDQQQLQASADATTALIEREIERGIASERIVVAGFSQGGCVALQSALTYPQPLAGLMAMSTFFASHESIQPHPANRKLPIHVFHGSHDPMVPEALGLETTAKLKSMGYQTEYKSYPMEHGVCPEQIRDISAWLQRLLG